MSQISCRTAEQLSEAFAEFEDASRALGLFYRDLERQVARLSEELAQARAAEAREYSEKERLARRLQSLLDALPGGVVVLDQHGRVQSCNPVAGELLGPVACGEGWSDVVERAFAPRWDDGHDVSLADGRRVNIATQALDGEPGQILLISDVTETRRLHEQLEHHKRLSAKTEMAAAMAHQIRTPLASALLSAGNLVRAPNDDTRERAAQRTVRSLRKLERLVDEMLLFARGGRFEMAPTTTGALLDALRVAADEACGYKDYAVVFEAPADNDRIQANVSALCSVILNLIENAHQAAAGRGCMTVRCSRQGAAVQLLFADDGPGITDVEQGRIFEPFYTTRSNGTGLGLPVARAVARAHGGDLVLKPGTTGCCFVLSLPVFVPAAAAGPVAAIQSEHAHAS